MLEESLKRFQINKFSFWVGKTVNRLLGWRTEGSLSGINQAIVVVAHHTSNWDFLIGFMASLELKFAPFWIGKDTLFRPPMGRFMHWLGGIPIDRSSSQNLVEQTINIFRKHKNFLLVIAPEGTRKKVDKWKSGFYHIAQGANVPIVCAFLDYKRKVVGIGPAIIPSDNMEADIKKIRDFYSRVTGKHPEKQGEVQIVMK